MLTHETVDIVLDIDDREVPLREVPVMINRASHPGFRSYGNGDPGEPPYDEMTVEVELTRQELILLIKEAIAEAHGSVAVAAEFAEHTDRVLDEFYTAVAAAASRF